MDYIPARAAIQKVGLIHSKPKNSNNFLQNCLRGLDFFVQFLHMHFSFFKWALCPINFYYNDQAGGPRSLTTHILSLYAGWAYGFMFFSSLWVGCHN